MEVCPFKDPFSLITQDLPDTKQMIYHESSDDGSANDKDNCVTYMPLHAIANNVEKDYTKI